jgi:DNA-binding CsgD family transcriptional regulator
VPDVFDDRPGRERIYQALEEALRRNTDTISALRDSGAELELLVRAAQYADTSAGDADPGLARPPGYPAIEATDGSRAGLEAIDRMQRYARRELRIIDMPPYHGTPERYAAQEVLQAERMAAGIGYRVIYSRAACDDPVAGPNLVRMAEHGEQARTLADPPMKLVLADDELAALPLPTESTVLLVHHSALLDALTRMFETLWRLAIPVSADGDAPLDERDRLILTLLASGATDDAIARRMGVNRRTVVRRVSTLQERLGATTRFQAGLQAGRRGWL